MRAWESVSVLCECRKCDEVAANTIFQNGISDGTMNWNDTMKKENVIVEFRCPSFKEHISVEKKGNPNIPGPHGMD